MEHLTKVLLSTLSLTLLASPTGSRAQTTAALTTLHSFAQVGTDGGQPGSLTPGSDGNLYGTTAEGGGQGHEGTVFKITMGGAITILYRFERTGRKGAIPVGVVEGSDGNFYGATFEGGSAGDTLTLSCYNSAGKGSATLTLTVTAH